MNFQIKRKIKRFASTALICASLYSPQNVYPDQAPYQSPRASIYPFNEPIQPQTYLRNSEPTNSTSNEEENSASSSKYQISAERKSTTIKTLEAALSRANQIISDKTFSDLGYRFNFTGVSEHYWATKKTTDKYKDAVLDGFEDSFKRTPLYQNVQETAFDIASTLMRPLLKFTSNLFGKKANNEIKATFDLNLGTDVFEDPYVRNDESLYNLELRPDSMRIAVAGKNALKFRIGPSGIDAVYRDEIAQNFYVIAGAGISTDIKIEQLKFNINENRWAAQAGIEGEVGKGWRILIKGSINEQLSGRENSRHATEQKIFGVLNKTF